MRVFDSVISYILSGLVLLIFLLILIPLASVSYNILKGEEPIRVYVDGNVEASLNCRDLGKAVINPKNWLKK